MELRNLRTFITICDSGSFSSAAQILGYAQSSVTAQIKQLEIELETLLFDRIGKKVSLTPGGQRLLKEAREIIFKADNMALVLKQPQSYGIIRIGIEESLAAAFLPDILEKFYAKFPKTQVVIQLGTGYTLSKMLKDNIIDLIWCFEDDTNNASWTYVKQIDHKLTVACSAQNPLAQKEVLVSELEAEKFIFAEPGCLYRNILQNYFALSHAGLQVFMEIKNTQVICQLISRGIGITFLPLFVVKQQINNGQIAPIHIKQFSPSVCSVIAYHQNKSLTQGTQAFLEFMLQELEPNS